MREYRSAISPEAHVKATVRGRTAPPADLLESCHLLAKKNSGVTLWQWEFNHWPKRPDTTVTANRSHPSCTSVDEAGRCKSNRNATTAHSSSSGLWLHHSKRTIHPSLCYSTPTDMLFLPPSCHRTHKNEVRTRAHIRRAGGSTLSGVRNNSFWPSPACALKWSPWVAAYQRAAAIEWVVGITQPGFRTYTGHSKGRAHWAREIHGEAVCARSSFDWDYMITIPSGFMMALPESLRPAEHACIYAKAEVELAICYDYQTGCDV